jgi:hypothetical protein
VTQCDIADDLSKQLRKQLREAFASWNDVRDIPGKQNEERKAQKKVHNIQRALIDHVVKHGCNKDSEPRTLNTTSKPGIWGFSRPSVFSARVYKSIPTASTNSLSPVSNPALDRSQARRVDALVAARLGDCCASLLI